MSKSKGAAESMTLNVRVTGLLREFVAGKVGEDGAYDNVSEYVRNLIRRDRKRIEAEGFARLKAELKTAFAAPESSYEALEADAIIARNSRR